MSDLPYELKARAAHELRVLLYDKVLVLVHEVVRHVCHPAGVVLHPEAVLGPFGSCKAWLLRQSRPQRVSQILSRYDITVPQTANATQEKEPLSTQAATSNKF